MKGAYDTRVESLISPMSSDDDDDNDARCSSPQYTISRKRRCDIIITIIIIIIYARGCGKLIALKSICQKEMIENVYKSRANFTSRDDRYAALDLQTECCL